MQVFRRANALPIDATTHFDGPIRSEHRVAYTGDVPVHTYHVEFADGGRTHWHRHTGPQWLFVTHGRIRVQKWGEPAVDLGEGDTVVVEPGEKHWHGAAPAGSGTHLAVNINSTTDWLEPVTED